MPFLAPETLRALYEAAVAAHLAEDREGLLAGIAPQIRADLPYEKKPGAQLYSDLHALNRRHRDQAVPLCQWLENAVSLSTARREGEVFQRALAELQAVVTLMSGRGGAEDRARRAEPFVGRHHLFAEVESFLSTERAGYLSITGPSGSGKTAWVEELVHRSGCLAHFVDFTDGDEGFTEAIRAEVRCRFQLPELRRRGGSERGEALADTLRGCARWLSHDDPLVIAIDAIDDVDPAALPPDARDLGLPRSLPDHVFFLLTHRLALPSLEPSAPRRVLAMEAYEAENEADAREWVEVAARRVGVAAWLSARSMRAEELAAALSRRCHGNFMYLRRVIEAIDAGGYADRSVESLPGDLHAYHEERWDALARAARRSAVSCSEEDVNAVAYVLAEARRPVSRYEITNLTGVGAGAVDAALAELTLFLHVDRAQEPARYRIAHPSFREFLYWRDSVQAAGFRLAEHHARLDEALGALVGWWKG